MRVKLLHNIGLCQIFTSSSVNWVRHNNSTDLIGLLLRVKGDNVYLGNIVTIQ